MVGVGGGLAGLAAAIGGGAALPVATAAASGSMDGGTKERRKVRMGRNLVQLPAPKKGA